MHRSPSSSPITAETTTNNKAMAVPSDTVLCVFLIFQICIGVMGNSLLFGLYMYVFFLQPHLKKPIDSIFMHLALVNILTIIVPSLLSVTSFFGVRQFLDDVGCQALLFSYRVSRGLSIFTTSLLSAFQAVTISPGNSKWAWLKLKLSAWVLPSFLLFWIINMLIYIHIIQTVRAIGNFTVVGQGYAHAYCQTRQFTGQNPGSYISVLLVYDLVFLALMVCTSLYMISLLYRHHRRVQHVRSPHLSGQVSPEHRATHNILLLVGCFVFFYCSNNFMTFYSFYIHEKIPLLDRIAAVLSSCYPTICPFLLMRNNKFLAQFTSTFFLIRITCPQIDMHG